MGQDKPNKLSELSEQKKAQILLEEKYRHEVRQELGKLAPPLNWRKRLWEFLNSHFGLFLLSSVVVGFLSWGYTQYDKQRMEYNQKISTIDKLDAELTHRCYAIKSATASLRKPLPNMQWFQPIFQMKHALGGDPGTDGVLFPEHKDRTMVGLLSELLTLVSDGEKTQIQEAREAVSELTAVVEAEMPMVIDPDKPEPIDRVRAKTVANSIEKIVMPALKRWSRN